MKSTDNGWSEQIAAVRPDAEAAFVPGMTLDPHDGETSDLNLHLHDLMADPNPNVPDPMAGWTPEAAS